MRRFLIANPKGGSGKTTLATNLAGYFARRGRQVMLGETDPAQGLHRWLAKRSPALPAIRDWEVDALGHAVPPEGTTHLVIDAHGGLAGGALQRALRQVHHVIVPLGTGFFDRLPLDDFFLSLLAERQRRQHPGYIMAVINRIALPTGSLYDEQSSALQALEKQLQIHGIQLLATLEQSPAYLRAAEQGMTLFDLRPSTVAHELAQWRVISDWLGEGDVLTPLSLITSPRVRHAA